MNPTNLGGDALYPRASTVANQPKIESNFLSGNDGFNNNSSAFQPSLTQPNANNWGQQNTGAGNIIGRQGGLGGLSNYSNSFQQQPSNGYQPQPTSYSQMQQPVPSSNNMKYTFAMKKVVDGINQKTNISSINDYFVPFDIYEGRMLEQWELAIMFPTLAYQPDQVNAIFSELQSLQQPGKVDAHFLMKQIQVTATKPLNPLQQFSVYRDKLRNSPLSMTRMEQIAREILIMTPAKTYIDSFERLYIKENYINKDKLQNALASSQEQVKEAQALLNYLAIDDFQQISKIQFIQGLKQIQPEGVSFEQPIIMSQSNVPSMMLQDVLGEQHKAYLRAISEALAAKSLSLEQALIQAGVNSQSQHFVKSELQSMARQLGLLVQLSELEFQQLANILEDKQMKDCILISSLKKHLEQFSMQATHKTLEIEALKDKFLSQIKILLDKRLLKDLNDCFTDVQKQAIDKEEVPKSSFMAFLNQADMGLKPEEADKICQLYELPAIGVQPIMVNLCLVKKDLQSKSSARSFQMSMPDALKVSEGIYERIKKLLAREEINIIDIFNDNNRPDSMIGVQDLEQILNIQLGLIGLTPEDFNAIYLTLDPRKTGKLDQEVFLQKFFEYANSKRIQDPSDKLYQFFQEIRGFLRSTGHYSLSSLFTEGYGSLAAADKPDDEIPIHKYIFQQRTERKIPLNSSVLDLMVLRAGTGAADQIGLYKLADLIGYEKPACRILAYTETMMRDAYGVGIGYNQYSDQGQEVYQKLKSSIGVRQGIRRFFFRTILSSFQSVEQLKTYKNALQRETMDSTLTLPQLKNITQKYCVKLAQSKQLEEFFQFIVSSDFKDINKEKSATSFIEVFCEKMQREYIKLQLIVKIFAKFYQVLKFKEIDNLYILFQKYDSKSEKQFNANTLTLILKEKNLQVSDQEMTLLFEEYAVTNKSFIKYMDLESDYKVVTSDPRFSQFKAEPISQILFAIKIKMDKAGQTLPQLFHMDRAGATDKIKQMDFRRIMRDIYQGDGVEKQTTLDMLIEEITPANQTNDVSFQSLLQIFGERYGNQGIDMSKFVAADARKLMQQIGKRALLQRQTGFSLERHFTLPQCQQHIFLQDLAKEPFNLIKTNIEKDRIAIASQYPLNQQYVDTNRFLMELQRTIDLIERKNLLYLGVSQKLQRKNVNMEKVVKQTIPEVEKFDLDVLSLLQYHNLFQAQEYKCDISELERIFNEFYNAEMIDNNSIGYSCKAFLLDFNDTVTVFSQGQGGRMFKSLEEVIGSIATAIEMRPIKNFGQILADQDIDNKQVVANDLFFRAIESLQFGLGKGDIELLIQTYAKDKATVDITRFRDELNYKIIRPEYKIVLKSLLHDAVKERIVEQVDLSPRTSKKKTSLEEEAQNKFVGIVTDLVSGLLCKACEVQQWFERFSTYVKGSLTEKEFTSGLDALGMFAQDAKLKSAYYAHLLERQEVYTNNKSQLLIIEQLANILSKDCPMNREAMIDHLLNQIAQSLTESLVPIRDTFEIFDTSRSGQVFKADFSTNILDNYLRLSSILTINKKQLLVQRYAPSESILQLNYNLFIEDLLRKQRENPSKIKLFQTQFEADEYKKVKQDQQKLEIQDTKVIEQRQREPDPEPRSKMNTVCILREVYRQLKTQIPSFQFEDIMIETYRKGQAVEIYFRNYAEYKQREYYLEKPHFIKAITQLNLKWGDQQRVSELFDAIDVVSHQNYQRQITPQDIGEVVLTNAVRNINDYQAIAIESIYQGLKSKQMLAKLRDLFNFYNTRRDNTCLASEYKSVMLDKLGLKQLVTDNQMDLLVMRYKAMQDGSRVEFVKFIRDMEYCDLGINAQVIWAIDLAECIQKGLIVNNFQNPESFFTRFSKTPGQFNYEEFRAALDELRVSMHYEDQEIKDFFSYVESKSNNNIPTGAITSFSKVSMRELCDTIAKLCSKNLAQFFSEILERVHTESKKNNLTITVYTIFTDQDLQKTGHVHFNDFKYAIEEKIGAHNLKPYDLQVLARRYRSNQRNMPQDMIQYEKFFQDYEQLDKLGLRAGFDPMKTKQDAAVAQQAKSELPPEVKKIYNDMSTYATRNQIIEKFCDSFAIADVNKTGMMTDLLIHEIYKKNKLAINKTQLNHILLPLPCDQSGNFSYLTMIDMLFGRVQMTTIQARHKIMGSGLQRDTGMNQPQAPQVQLEMRTRLKDQIELRFQQLQSYAHSISRSSYLLREQEFLQIFKKANIMMLSEDLDLLTAACRQLRNSTNQALDFRQFIRHFNISDTTSVLLAEIQRQLPAHNVKIEDLTAAQKDAISYEEFYRLLQVGKVDTTGFTNDEIRNLFDQMAERRDTLEKQHLIRVIRNNLDQKDPDLLPYIVNELVYYICNNAIDIFKLVNPSAKALTIEQFKSLLIQIKFKPSNPKEIPTLMTFLAVDGQEQQVSIEKFVSHIRKVVPTYGQVKASGPAQQNQQAQGTNGQQAKVSKSLSLFNTKVKAVLQKINAHLKKVNMTVKDFYHAVDANKDGSIEKQEMLNYFSRDLGLKSIPLADLELLFECLDMNKDGVLSINEMCLCLQGIQQTLDQRMKSFDLDLEKDMVKEINQLFDFFDKNGDAQITVEELLQALRSVNQNIGLKEAQAMMRLADTDQNKTIDRSEFLNIMLPKFKEEVLKYEQNMEDLRRLFQESDLDHSNYLTKDELKLALLKLQLDLTDVQLDDILREIDLDGNDHIDIDEFIAFLSIADQIKFKNPQAKTSVIKLRHARKLHAMDFFNSFKNLPQCFLPSFLTEVYEKQYKYSPSHGIYPEFESKTMAYKDLYKCDEVGKYPARKFIDMYQGHVACEVQMEECCNIPMPKKEDFDWTKITHREVRAVLFDFRTSEYLSNSIIIGAQWKLEFEGKWLFNSHESLNQAKNFLLRTDLLKRQDNLREIYLLFELVVYTTTQDLVQQVTCAWGSIPAEQLDKQAKHKVVLKGGSPLLEIKIEQSELHQEKKGFSFLKKLATQVEDPQLVLNIKPFPGKFSEQTQLYMALLPSSCIVSKRLLSFVATYRYYCFKKLNKAQQQMTAPQGNFVIAQFRKVFDNPDMNLLMADCWEQEVNLKAVQSQPVNMELMVKKMEEFMGKLYSIIYSAEFCFDHVFPTRSSGVDSQLFKQREVIVKNALLPGKYKAPAADKKKKPDGKENEDIIQLFSEDYKPFNISEMDIPILGFDTLDSKQDQLLKMYQQIGLIQ